MLGRSRRYASGAGRLRLPALAGSELSAGLGMSVGEQSCRQLVGRSLSGDHVGRKRPRRALALLLELRLGAHIGALHDYFVSGSNNKSFKLYGMVVIRA